MADAAENEVGEEEVKEEPEVQQEAEQAPEAEEEVDKAKPSNDTKPSKAAKTPRAIKSKPLAEIKDKPVSPRRSRCNKIYRTPPTPAPAVLQEKERTFILDSRAVSNISQIYSRANPKLGPVIPPYNAQKDKGATTYFTSPEVKKVLTRTGQAPPGTSIDGPVMDYFFEKGAGARYLTRRNINGNGRSSFEMDGHSHFMDDIKPVLGYNGPFGYRRTTPNLRHMPSPFGVDHRSPLY